MDSKSEQALKELATQAKEATMNMEREEAAEFFDRLFCRLGIHPA